MDRFKGKTVLVTGTFHAFFKIQGGAQGIGKGTCIAFLKEGADVICTDDKTFKISKRMVFMHSISKIEDIREDLGMELEKECKDCEKGSLSFLQMDASKGEDCKRVVESVLRKFQRIDILFNNVGVQPKASGVPIHELSEELWDHIFNVNIKSFYWMSKYVLPNMLQHNNGVILNNASVQGLQSQPGVAAYAASKGAILSLTRQLACEYQYCSIHSKGCVVTPLALENNKSFEYVTNNTPLRKLGTPEDIAAMVTFLASEEAKWITGQTFVVDGGISVKGGWATLPE